MIRASGLCHSRLSFAFCVLVLGGCRADGPPNSALSEWVLPTDEGIHELIARHVDAAGVGMVVGVVDSRGSRIVSYGDSRVASGSPVDGESVFQLGSLTKPITTLLLADMVVRDEVALDDAIGRYVPSLIEVPDAIARITLRQLASHTSGLPSMPDNFDLRGDPNPYASYSAPELWSYLASLQLPASAGTQSRYSNLGVSLLGHLLALRLGSTYEAVIQERVLSRLGMQSTSITLDAELLARQVDGHGPYRNPVRTWEMATLQASGSLRSTAEDMLLLLEAYLGHRETPLDRAIEVQLTGRGGGTLSWGALDDGTFRHAGGKAGYRSGIAFNTTTGIGAVVLANTRTLESTPIQLATHLVTGIQPPPTSAAPSPKRVAPMTSNELDVFEGTYALANGGEIEVVRSGTHLLARYENHSILEFSASGPREFFLTSGNDDLVFDRAEDGTVLGLIRYGDGRGVGDGEYARRLTVDQRSGASEGAVRGP